MKNTFIAILLCITADTSLGQVVAMQNDLQNIMYYGVANPITVAADGVKPSELVLTSSNCNIYSDSFSRAGHYIVWPKRAGDSWIYMSKKEKNGRLKIIDSTLLQVRPLPLPSAHLIRSDGAFISQLMLLIQVAPEATYNESCAKVSITSFTLEVYRKANRIFRRAFSNPNGTRFDSITHDFFYHVKNSDKIFFRNITTIGPDRMTRVIEPLMLTITSNGRYRKLAVPDTTIVVDPVTGIDAYSIEQYRFIKDDE